jgi:serine/threonine protein kinase
MPTFLCPHCRRQITTSQDLTGKPLRCPSCQKPFTFAQRQQTVTRPPRRRTQAQANGESAPAAPQPAGEQTLPLASRAEAKTLAPAVADEQATLAPATPAAADGKGKPAIAGYQIERELGRGGMGVVYQALDLRLKRRVALKMVLAGGHAGEAALARFRTEAEAVARLQHPNIVQIHEVGVHEGLPFFCLEFCPGGSLDRKLDGTPLPPAEAAALVEKLALAMQTAHGKGVIHRDLKPANVPLGEDGAPKITDFGLARKLDEVGQRQTGSIMGTPSYMASEQAGGSKNIGPAADVYALGAILYELLTGRPPFKAATPWTRSCRWSATSRRPPPSYRARRPGISRPFPSSACGKSQAIATQAPGSWPRTCAASRKRHVRNYGC